MSEARSSFGHMTASASAAPLHSNPNQADNENSGQPGPQETYEAKLKRYYQLQEQFFKQHREIYEINASFFWDWFSSFALAVDQIRYYSIESRYALPDLSEDTKLQYLDICVKSLEAANKLFNLSDVKENEDPALIYQGRLNILLTVSTDLVGILPYEQSKDKAKRDRAVGIAVMVATLVLAVPASILLTPLTGTALVVGVHLLAFAASFIFAAGGYFAEKAHCFFSQPQKASVKQCTEMMQHPEVKNIIINSRSRMTPSSSS